MTTMHTDASESVSGDVVDTAPNLANVYNRGEVDVQISTAKRYPRSIGLFKKRAMDLATLDEDTASSCFYALPRGGKTIEGPSVRFAEIVAASWGNMRAQADIVAVLEDVVVARGLCWDLETNVAVSVEVRRRITNKSGRRYDQDMIGVTSNAACSIALRNAVFKVVPMALAKSVYEAARKCAVGDASTLAARRADMVAYFAKMGVQPPQVFAAVSKASIEDITLDDLATLKGMATAIKDGDTSVDEAFPRPTVPGAAPTNGSRAEGLAAAMKAKNEALQAEAAKPAADTTPAKAADAPAKTPEQKAADDEFTRDMNQTMGDGKPKGDGHMFK